MPRKKTESKKINSIKSYVEKKIRISKFKMTQKIFQTCVDLRADMQDVNIGFLLGSQLHALFLLLLFFFLYIYTRKSAIYNTISFFSQTSSRFRDDATTPVPLLLSFSTYIYMRASATSNYSNGFVFFSQYHRDSAMI